MSRSCNTDTESRLLAALAAEPDPHTTVADPERDHVLDSRSGLEVPELRAARSIADIGAGAGFPGLVLALELAAASVDLVESSRRKADMIARLVATAGIGNARPIHARVEEWGAGEGREAYDAATARAVAPLGVLVEYAAPLLRPGGVLVAWKAAVSRVEADGGQHAADALGMSPRPPVRVEPWPEARDRWLHVFEKTGPTPAGFPRRPGMASKRPL